MPGMESDSGRVCQLALLIVLGPVVASESVSLGEGLPPGPLPSWVPVSGFILRYLLTKNKSFSGRVELLQDERVTPEPREREQSCCLGLGTGECHESHLNWVSLLSQSHNETWAVATCMSLSPLVLGSHLLLAPY